MWFPCAHEEEEPHAFAPSRKMVEKITRKLSVNKQQRPGHRNNPQRRWTDTSTKAVVLGCRRLSLTWTFLEAFRKAALIYAIWNKATLSESSSRLSTSSSVDLRQKWVYARDQIWAIFQKQMKTLAKRLSCCLQSLSSYHKIMFSPAVKTARPCPDCQLISLKEFWKPQLLPAGIFCLAYCEIKIDHLLYLYLLLVFIIFHQNVLTSERTFLFSSRQLLTIRRDKVTERHSFSMSHVMQAFKTLCKNCKKPIQNISIRI